ncbi:acetyl-CoA carboxylase biotin carboxylase subunit family protein [Streptomyces sp. NPDC007901]|uniref:ATP-grasp domain-containing protein n=1 Tax=Streptomyces sp. NPDC007901 TaxID=3364785 RepID=UPI0036E77752
MTRGRPRLAVVYDDGAVSPGELGVGLADTADAVFLVPDTPHVAAMLPVLEQLGAVHSLTGDPAGDATLIRHLAPDGVTTFSEFMIRTTAGLAAAAGLPYHLPDTALLLTDKALQRAALRRAGVDDVRSARLGSPADWPSALAAVGLPAVIKPVRGAGSRHTHPVYDKQQAARLVSEVFAQLPAAPEGGPRLVVEELLPGRPSAPFGDCVSVESLCAPDGITHLAVSGKLPLVRPFRQPGRFWPHHLPDTDERAVLALVTGALTALGVQHGLTHTEVKLTPAGPRLIEVNGRLGGHVNGMARTACGVDLVRAAARYALGRDPGLAPLRPDRVHFQHNGLAPTKPCRLLGVHGAAQLRRREGISGYRTFVRLGEQLPGGVMTHELDVIWGVADDHDSMVRLIERALETLSYEFAFADGRRTVSAASCGAWQDAVPRESERTMQRTQ